MGQRRNGLPPARRSVSQPLGGHHGQATALPSSAEMDELRHKHSKVKRGGESMIGVRVAIFVALRGRILYFF